MHIKEADRRTEDDDGHGHQEELVGGESETGQPDGHFLEGHVVEILEIVVEGVRIRVEDAVVESAEDLLVGREGAIVVEGVDGVRVPGDDCVRVVALAAPRGPS